MAKQTGQLRYEWPLQVAALNRRASRKRLKQGELSQCYGADGRFVGGVRKHAGMDHLTTLTVSTAAVDFWYVSIQKGTTTYSLRGFLTLYNDSSTYKLKFDYYDEDPARAAWESYTLTGITLAATSEIDVAGPSKFSYIAIDGQAPRVLYNTAAASGDASAAFVHGEMGPGALFDSVGDTGLAAPTYDSGTGEVASGYLTTGIYSIAYRFYDSARGIYSALSGTLTQTITGVDVKVDITNPYAADLDAAYDQGYDELHVFRSMTAEVAGNHFEAGMFYKETEYTLDSGADCWPAAVTVGTARDEDLLWEEVYDAIRDVNGSPPQSGTIEYLNGACFMGSDSSAGSVITQLQWSPLHTENPEVFPASGHSHRWSSPDGPVTSFVRAGDMLYAFAEGAAYRLARSGAQLAISRMHGGRSLTGRRAADELGRDVIAVTHLGVTLFDGATGAIHTIGALDRVIFDDWVASLADIYVASDPSMGVTYILNTTAQEAACVWHVTGAVSMLDDMNFIGAVTGPDPVAGGVPRVWFMTADGRVVYPDLAGDGTDTMMGLPSNVTINGTATGGSTTTIELTGASNWTDANLTGGIVYVWKANDPTADPQSAEITSQTGGNTLNFSAISTAVAAGDRFTISPVPFRLRGWPLFNTGSPPDFGRKNVRAMGVYADNQTGIAGNVNASWRMGVCKDFEDTPGASIKVVTMDDDPSEAWGGVSRDGNTVEPWVEQISAGVGFELLSVGMDATITVTRQAGQ